MNATSSAATPQATASTAAAPARTIHDVLAQIDVADFDWKAYEGTYQDRALITRLNHIPTLILNASSPASAESLQLARGALQRLLPLVKATWDTHTYLRIATALEDTRHGVKVAKKGEDQVMESADAPTAIPAARGEIDMNWVEEAKEAERRETMKLDVDLRNYMSNLIKESIRLTYLAFARLSLKSGKASEALKNYASAREFSTSPAHHVELGVGIIETSLAFNQPSALSGHIPKLDAALDRAYPAPVAAAVRVGADAAAAAEANLTGADVRDNQEKAVRSAEMRRTVGIKIRVAKGLDALAKKDWEKAGRELGEVGEEGGLAGWEGQAISTADLALITALCTLVSSKRDRMRRVLLDRASFRSSVDDSQAWIIDLVRAFMEANYGEVTIILNKVEPQLVLNPFLSPHVRDIINLIQTRAVVQYVAPFSSIQLDVMGRAFDREPRSMLGEVEMLVRDGRISGRIDLIDGVLEMKQENVRGELFKEAMKVAKKTNTMSRAALVRMRLHEAGISVDPRPPSEVHAGGQKLRGSSSGPMDLTGIDDFEMMDSGRGGPPGGYDGEGFVDSQATR